MTAKGGPHIEIRALDLDILLALFECRVMTQRQICELHFGGKVESAKKRLQKLKRDGYVRERPRGVGDPCLLHLSTKAFTALQDSGRLASFPPISRSLMEKRSQVSEATLRHELAVGDVRTAFYKALAGNPKCTIEEFRTWPLLFQFTARYISAKNGQKEVILKPDAFIRIRQDDNGNVRDHFFFLELDRSSESQEIIAQKALCYLDFYQRGGMALRFGKMREDFRQFPFRVLMVFQNDERRNNAAERLLQNLPPIMTQVWLTTLAEAVDSTLGEIWIRPKDYQEAIRDTQFGPTAANRNGVYRRSTERERLLQRRGKKTRLF